MGFDFKGLYEVAAVRESRGGELNEEHKRAAALLLKHQGKARTFLDIGCGEGDISLALADNLETHEIYGVDIAETYLAKARAKGIITFQVDLNSERLPLADGAIDSVFCGEVIDHLVNPDNLLSEIHRVLTPGGILVITAFNLAAWMSRVGLFFFGWQPFGTAVSFYHDVGRPKFLSSVHGGEHIRVFTRRALHELLEVYHLKVLETRGVGVFEGSVSISHLAKHHGTTGRLDMLKKMLLFAIGVPVDKVAAYLPSLAHSLVVVARKEGPY